MTEAKQTAKWLEDPRLVKAGKRERNEQSDDLDALIMKKIRLHDQAPSWTAIQKALLNDLILQSVFKYLPTRDLLQCCRLVNLQWNRVAIQILKRRINAFVKVNGKTDFKALEDCIKNSPDFPFRQIDLACCKNNFENSPEKWLEVDLVRQYSSLFSRLQLTSCHVPDNILCQLLSGSFNHIQWLTLNEILRAGLSLRWKKDEHLVRFDGNFAEMKNLRTVAIGNDAGCDGVHPAFLLALLRSCPHLQRIENITNAHLFALSAAGKLGTVKSLRACPCIDERGNYPVPSGLEMLIIAQGRQWDDSRPCNASLKFSGLRSLLESNRETLRRIEVYSPVFGGNVNKGEDWPKLSNLTSLKLMKSFGFPDNVDEIFPVLQTVEFAAYPDDGIFWEKVEKFMWKEALPSVNVLEVVRPYLFSPKDWKHLAKVMPNVSQVFLGFDDDWSVDSDDPDNSYSTIDDIEVTVPWKSLSYLKQLEALYVSPIHLEEINLDRLFTGISELTVEKLKKDPQLALPELNDRESVASLKCLKQLVVGLTRSSTTIEEDLKEDCPISQVSLQYGFDMAPPDLKILFVYDYWSKHAKLIKEALRPVADRVTFSHATVSDGHFGMAQGSSDLAFLQRTEHPRQNSEKPWLDKCRRRPRQTARRGGGIPRPWLDRQRGPR